MERACSNLGSTVVVSSLQATGVLWDFNNNWQYGVKMITTVEKLPLKANNLSTKAIFYVPSVAFVETFHCRDALPSSASGLG